MVLVCKNVSVCNHVTCFEDKLVWLLIPSLVYYFVVGLLRKVSMKTQSTLLSGVGWASAQRTRQT